MEAALGQYLTATPEGRKVLCTEFPELFTEDILEELHAAEHVMEDARIGAADAMRTGRSLFNGLGVSEGVSKDDAMYSPANSEVLLSAEGQVASFQAILATLLSQQLSDEDMARQVQERMRLVAEACPAVVMTSSSAAGRKAGGGVVKNGETALLPSDLLMKVFSFLPIEAIIDTTEHVCGNWNRLTTANEQSQSFWIGCAQREFPAEVAALVAAEGSALFDADWRTIAVMAAATAESEGDDAEES